MRKTYTRHCRGWQLQRGVEREQGRPSQAERTGLTREREQLERLAAGKVDFKQLPEMKAIKAAGHETGDFFLVPKASR